MKKTVLYLALLLQAIIINAQQVPHTFQNGQIIDAEQMNENFRVAAASLRKGTVDCNNGEKISDKLKEYNYLTISGVCTDNLFIDSLNRSNYPESWDWKEATGITKFVFLEGATGKETDGITAANPDQRVIYVNGQLAVFIQDLTITGGQGVRGDWGALVGLNRVTVKNSSQQGLLIARGIGFVGESSFDTNDNGIVAEYGASLYVRRSTIENSNYAGVGVWHGANAQIGQAPQKDENGNIDFSVDNGNIIKGSRVGVSVADSSFLRMIGNTITCYDDTGVRASETSTLDLGVDWEQAGLTETSHPLHINNQNYSTNKLKYGNLIDGSACTGRTRRNWHHGVQVREASSMRLFRTIIKNNQENGINTEGNSSISLGGGNEIRDNGRNGFNLNETVLNQWSYQQEIEPILISGNGEDAFRLDSSDLHLNGGRIIDEQTDAIISESNRMVISGHRVGINATRSRITLERVDIQNNTSHGISVDSSSLNVRNTTVSSNAGTGILIHGSSIRMSNSTIKENGDRGLQLIGGSNAVLYDKNAITNNAQYGLLLERRAVLTLEGVLEVKNNGGEVLIRGNSAMLGGWSDDNSYMYQFETNDGMRVIENSNLDVSRSNIAGGINIENSVIEINSSELFSIDSEMSSIRMSNVTVNKNFNSEMSSIRMSNVTVNENINLDKTNANLYEVSSQCISSNEGDIKIFNSIFSCNEFSALLFHNTKADLSSVSVTTTNGDYVSAIMLQNSNVTVYGSLDTGAVNGVDISIVDGSNLYLNDPEDYVIRNISIEMNQESELHFNSAYWASDQINCYNNYDNESRPIYRDAVIYSNGNGSNLSGIDSNCIFVE